jgi:hypothetical protein
MHPGVNVATKQGLMLEKGTITLVSIGIMDPFKFIKSLLVKRSTLTFYDIADFM